MNQLARLDRQQSDADLVEALCLEALEHHASCPDADAPFNPNYLTIADRRLAQAEIERGEYLAALDRIRGALNRPGLLDSSTATLLDAEAMAYRQLGLPDKAFAPLERASLLLQGELEATGVTNFGAYSRVLKKRLGLLMAEGHDHEAVELAAQFDAELEDLLADDRISPKNRKRLANTRTAVAYRRGLALAVLALRARESPEEAMGLIAQALDSGRLGDEDALSARRRLAYHALDGGHLDTARRHWEAARKLTAQLGDRPIERARLAGLTYRLATRSTGANKEEALENLVSSIEALLETWRASTREGGLGFLRYLETRRPIAELLATQSDIERARTLVRCGAFGSLWRGLGSPLPSFEEVRAALTSKSTGCVAFFPGYDELYVVAFDRERLWSRRLPRNLGTTHGLRELARLVGRRPPPPRGTAARVRERDLTALIESATKSLFPDELEALLASWSEVLLVGRDLLFNVPLELLLPLGEPLGVTHATSHAPSLACAWALAARPLPRRDAGTTTIIGCLEGELLNGGQLDQLKMAGDRNPTVLDADATPERALAALSSSAVTHFFAHGEIDYELEVRPSLQLAPSRGHPTGRLRFEHLLAANSSPLVVLSACRTAHEPGRLGDAGAAHLGGAFLRAGARCVIQNAHDTSLPAAHAMGVQLHRSLRAGASPAAALRDARVTLRRDPRYADPFHWALPHCFGLGVALEGPAQTEDER